MHPQQQQQQQQMRSNRQQIHRNILRQQHLGMAVGAQADAMQLRHQAGVSATTSTSSTTVA
jgi:hypothetical protein